MPKAMPVPWYVVAGNQDALGNVSASIAYSALSPRWRHPDFYHAVRVADAGGSGVGLDVLMLDLTLCYGIWSDPVHDAMCAAQLAWLDAQLAASTAGFLLVAGHYPVFSACAHGNTQWAIDTLLPRLVAHNVTAYLSGHDHCGEFMAPATAAGLGDLVFAVSGAGDGCSGAFSDDWLWAGPAGAAPQRWDGVGTLASDAGARANVSIALDAPPGRLALSAAALFITASMMGHMFARVGAETLAAKPWLYFMMSGGLAIAFVIPALWTSYTHQRISTRLALIDAGFWLMAYLTIGLTFFLLKA
jgi:hypothetical protein